ncbi:phytanoyl-CoA dioxygenase family protein [Paraglaciecola sp. 2405UD69-4]|uniref:phytanoyl-CoA dioxygenase family protein n=1 Tax=Paraglaciecola sp. 2405UD69-4 TaxID=3391836 RepID=UPI0039C9E38C
MKALQTSWATQYEDQGYFVIRNYFSESEMSALRDVISVFHEKWKQDNAKFYEEVAFNSSLVTGSQYLGATDRMTLFNFISSPKMMQVIESLIPTQAAFMNTQLFFNPINPELKDFWHRDCQYDHDLAGQKKAIAETQVVHLRVPLFDELGMELIPGTHKRWDTQEELDVREEENGRRSNDSLPGATSIPLAAGDVLVFSADMIHRGLYGLDRLAWDILVFDATADFADYVDPDCLPTPAMLSKIHDPRLFAKTLSLTSGN